MKAKKSQAEKVLVCPYCGDVKRGRDSKGCCGESSCHYEDAYLIDDEIYNEQDVEWEEE
jgi:hypothetical protein